MGFTLLHHYSLFIPVGREPRQDGLCHVKECAGYCCTTTASDGEELCSESMYQTCCRIYFSLTRDLEIFTLFKF